jgi:hypothetical protein
MKEEKSKFNPRKLIAKTRGRKNVEEQKITHEMFRNSTHTHKHTHAHGE